MIRSPIFYMGNKLDLLEDLLFYFPKDAENFYDVFGGSGTVSLNVDYPNIIYNELNENIVNLLKMFKEKEPKEIIEHIKQRVKQFDMNIEGTDVRQNSGNEENRSKFEQSYLNFRKFYNEQEEKTYLDLYTLTFYSFCNLIRFNQKNEFNMPYGNRCFTKDHEIMIYLACDKIKKAHNIEILNKDAFELLDNIKDNSFVYLDPPYSNTEAIYNEKRAFGGWTIESDIQLFQKLDKLNKRGIKWAMSNVLENKGKVNDHIKNWAEKNGYKIIYLYDKNYSALGKGNANSKEVLIVNYQPDAQQHTIFEFI